MKRNTLKERKKKLTGNGEIKHQSRGRSAFFYLLVAGEYNNNAQHNVKLDFGVCLAMSSRQDF